MSRPRFGWRKVLKQGRAEASQGDGPANGASQYDTLAYRTVSFRIQVGSHILSLSLDDVYRPTFRVQVGSHILSLSLDDVYRPTFPACFALPATGPQTKLALQPT